MDPFSIPTTAEVAHEADEEADTKTPKPSTWEAIIRQRRRMEMGINLLHAAIQTLNGLDNPRGSILRANDAAFVIEKLSSVADQMDDLSDQIRAMI